ncbi:hypothetical protein BJ165DRAFT_776702 [Panaeolus papilionaceus]|nr:hypothetical protein BJ165DRAFT_776702 [Panaeolus papilionaceus]
MSQVVLQSVNCPWVSLTSTPLLSPVSRPLEQHSQRLPPQLHILHLVQSRLQLYESSWADEVRWEQRVENVREEDCASVGMWKVKNLRLCFHRPILIPYPVSRIPYPISCIHPHPHPHPHPHHPLSSPTHVQYHCASLNLKHNPCQKLTKQRQTLHNPYLSVRTYRK